MTSTKGQIILADVPRPVAQPNSVLVRNLFSVVSPGTERAAIQGRSRNVVQTALKRKDLVQRVMAKARRDGILATMQAVKRKLEASLPLGYSCAGTAVEVGADIGDIRPGDMVACAGAGFACHAEYVCVPRMLCARVPDGVAPEAAAFTTLGAIALHGVRQAEIACGETVAVIGLGIMGQLVCQIVEAAGGRCIGLDIAPARVEMFRKLCRGSAVLAGAGAEQQVIELTEGRGADRVIITAASRSNEAIELAAAIARDRGRIVVLGDVLMQLPRQPFYEKELELRLSRSYGPGRYDAEYEIGGIDYPMAYVRWTENRNMQEFLRLVGTGAVKPLELVTHRFAIDESVKAYDAMGDSAAPPLGMVIAYPAESSERAPQRVTLRSRPRPKGKVGVAVVGAGNFARSVLLPTLAKMSDVSLEAVASARGVNARDLATKYGCDFCTTSFDEVIASDKVDAVFIATPHNLHADQALKALAAGKAVYLEKPLCISEEQLARLEEGVSWGGSMPLRGLQPPVCADDGSDAGGVCRPEKSHHAALSRQRRRAAERQLVHGAGDRRRPHRRRGMPLRGLRQVHRRAARAGSDGQGHGRIARRRGGDASLRRRLRRDDFVRHVRAFRLSEGIRRGPRRRQGVRH